MAKFKIKTQYLKSPIICIDDEGKEYLIHPEKYTDLDCERLIKNNKPHIVELLKDITIKK